MVAKGGLPGFWKVRRFVVSHILQGFLPLWEADFPSQSQGERGAPGLELAPGLMAGLPGEGCRGEREEKKKEREKEEELEKERDGLSIPSVFLQ